MHVLTHFVAVAGQRDRAVGRDGHPGVRLERRGLLRGGLVEAEPDQQAAAGQCGDPEEIAASDRGRGHGLASNVVAASRTAAWIRP